MCDSNRCGCRKHGFKCTDICTSCYASENCSNTDKKIVDDISDSEEAIDKESSVIQNEQLDHMDESDETDSIFDENVEEPEPKKSRLHTHL